MARRVRRKRRLTRGMRAGAAIVFVIMLLAFVVLVVRLVYILDVKSDKYSKRVLSQQTYVSNEILCKRGDIFDRNGTAMAVSTEVYDLVISPAEILGNVGNTTDNSKKNTEKARKEQAKKDADKEYTLQALVNFFGVDRSIIEADINNKPESRYMRLDDKKGLTKEETTAFEEYKKASEEANKKSSEDIYNPKIVGVWFEKRYARKYPLSEVGCDVIGFELNEHGERGIEQYYDDELTGTSGREYGYFDAELNLQRTVKPPIDGNNIISSIDSNVQGIVEKKIRKFMKKIGAKKVQVIMMNPDNGEVLAMASNKTYDLNKPKEIPKDFDFTNVVDDENKDITKMDESELRNYYWLNYGIGVTYEPGSTFKPFVVAAALDESTSNENSTYVCNGKMQVSNYEIGCANRTVHGIVTPRLALMKSCNCALMQIGAGLGRTQFYKYVKDYGFGNYTGIDLRNEQVGIIHKEDALNVVELATSSFGQTQNVTAIQMISAFCSLINGGYYYQPHVVKEIQSPTGSTVYKNRGNVLRQTVTKQTSDFIKEALRDTVTDGTATPAAITGYDIGGKTGTAEKGKRTEKKYIVSFIGFAPTTNPQVAVYVVIDEPSVDDQAHSTYATEFAHDILKETLPFLGVRRDYSQVPEDEKIADGLLPEGQTDDGQTGEGQTGDGQTGDGQTTEGQADANSDGASADNKTDNSDAADDADGTVSKADSEGTDNADGTASKADSEDTDNSDAADDADSSSPGDEQGAVFEDTSASNTEE